MSFTDSVVTRQPNLFFVENLYYFIKRELLKLSSGDAVKRKIKLLFFVVILSVFYSVHPSSKKNSGSVLIDYVLHNLPRFFVSLRSKKIHSYAQEIGNESSSTSDTSECTLNRCKISYKNLNTLRKNNS